MILRFKPYAVNDTLSRAYLASQAADQPDEFEIHVLDSGQLWQKVVMNGWPQTKIQTPVETRPYWKYRDEISC